MSGLIGLAIEVGIAGEILKKTKKLHHRSDFEDMGGKK
uniref:ORF61 n=1 Tax=Nitrosopumilaceae spindle-shaped virus TaxID=3065433 RepID=A0AAT9JAQ2_9VIRU